MSRDAEKELYLALPTENAMFVAIFKLCKVLFSNCRADPENLLLHCRSDYCLFALDIKYLCA